MWVVKVKGQTYYVHHLDSFIGFSTKENPGGKTQGSLKLRGNIIIKKIDKLLLATITKKTDE